MVPVVVDMSLSWFQNKISTSGLTLDDFYSMFTIDFIYSLVFWKIYLFFEYSWSMPRISQILAYILLFSDLIGYVVSTHITLGVSLFLIFYSEFLSFNNLF